MSSNIWDFKFSLGSDNHSGVHPQLLNAILEVNKNHTHSYGLDPITIKTQKMFRELFQRDIELYYVFNGTAANVLAISALMNSYNSVICSDIAHLQIDECGAPEKFIGCKVLTVESKNGKLTPDSILSFLIRKGDQHYSQPKVISITQPTEVGTVYTLSELEEIHKIAKEHDLKIHMDGARLLHAVQHLNSSFAEITKYVDSLSLGGTKNGMLGAEAVILFNNLKGQDFKFIRKQSMQLPSKMRFLSIQFLEFFQTELWKEIALHCQTQTQYFFKSVKGVQQFKWPFTTESNALFPSIPKKWIKPLKDHSFFYVWDETEWIVRWMISFDTQKNQIDSFVEKIKQLQGDPNANS